MEGKLKTIISFMVLVAVITKFSLSLPVKTPNPYNYNPETVTELMKSLRYDVEKSVADVYDRIPARAAYTEAHEYLRRVISDIGFYKTYYNDCPFVIVALDYDMRYLRGYLTRMDATEERRKILAMLEENLLPEIMHNLHVASKTLLFHHTEARQRFEHVCYSEETKSSLIDIYSEKL